MECYWENSLTGKDGKTENGSRKYRDKYFELNGNITNQEMADLFGISTRTIETHKYNYEWDRVLADKRTYEDKQRQQKRQEAYNELIDNDVHKRKTIMQGYDNLTTLALLKLGLAPNTSQITIPEWLSHSIALQILKDNPKLTRQIYNHILRDLEQEETIKNNHTTSADENKTTATLDDIISEEEALELINESQYSAPDDK